MNIVSLFGTRAKMSMLSEFRGRSIGFVQDWLEKNGLERLKQAFEGEKQSYFSCMEDIHISFAVVFSRLSRFIMIIVTAVACARTVVFLM